MATKSIASPLPGTFYRRQAPDKPFYKSEGDALAIGDVVGLIEVMKTFYEVKSEFAGTIRAFLAQDNDPVQAGQMLVEVDE